MFLPSIGKSGRVGTRAKPATLILFYGRTLASLIRLQRLQLLHHTKHCGQNCKILSKRNEIYLLSKSPKILWKCKKLFLEHYQFSISKQNPRLLFHLFSVKKGVMTFWTTFGNSGHCERPS